MKLIKEQATEDGTSSTFELKAADVGTFKSLELGMGKDDSDYAYMGVKRVEVTNKTSGAYGCFPVGQYVYSWCGLSSFDKAPNDTCYTITTSTVALTQAITFDGDVFVRVHGDKGTTEELKLANWWSSNSMQPGSEQTFYVTSCNVGAMSALTVRTGVGSASKWGLGAIDVINNTTSGQAAFEWGKFVNAGSTTKITKTDVKIEYQVRAIRLLAALFAAFCVVDCPCWCCFSSEDVMPLCAGDGRNWGRPWRQHRRRGAADDGRQRRPVRLDHALQRLIQLLPRIHRQVHHQGSGHGRREMDQAEAGEYLSQVPILHRISMSSHVGGGFPCDSSTPDYAPS